MANSDYNSGKASAVKFFMVLSCIASVVGGIASIARGNLTGGIILLVSLVWTIPMTVSAFRRLNAHEYIGTGFKICTLLFHNLIAGIILLCMSTEGEEEETTTIATDKKLTADTSNKNSSGTVAKPSAPVRTNSPKTTSTQKTTPQNTTSIQKTTPKNTTSLQAKTLATEHTGTYISTKPGVNNTGSSPYTSYTPTKNTSNDFHHWTYFENEYCVRMVFDNFVYHRYHNVSGVVDDIYEYLNCAIKPSSIHMKLSNIKYLLIEEDIPNSLSVKPLSQVSDDCRRAFKRVYAKYIEDGEYIEYPLKGRGEDPDPTGGTDTGRGQKKLPTYKIKVILNGEKYFYRHNVNDNANNLIKNEFSYLMATALYKVESKITAEALQKQYPTAIIEIVENVSDR